MGNLTFFSSTIFFSAFIRSLKLSAQGSCCDFESNILRYYFLLLVFDPSIAYIQKFLEILELQKKKRKNITLHASSSYKMFHQQVITHLYIRIFLDEFPSTNQQHVFLPAHRWNPLQSVFKYPCSQFFL